MSEKVRAVLIGCGGMARHHMRRILTQDSTEFNVVSEPSEVAYAEMVKVFAETGLEPPINEPDLTTLLRKHAAELDAAFIITPHKYHFEQAKACLEAGLDVLLEKPMVMNADEARSLIKTRDETGKLLVVSFNGSLSPNIRTAVDMLRSGDLGEVLNIHCHRLARLESQDSWRMASGPSDCRGRFYVRHRCSLAQHCIRPYW